MNPQINTSSILAFISSKRFKKIALISVVSILVLIILGILYNTHTQPIVPLHRLSISSSANATLKGEWLYSFNGISFIKTNINTGEVLSLWQGRRLPSVQSIWWADDDGAFITVGGALYGTEFYTHLKTADIALDSNIFSQYVWYVNFSSKKISLVTRTPFFQNLAHFNAEKHLFYYGVTTYSTGNSAGDDLPFNDVATNTATTLFAFDTKSGENKPLGSQASFSFVENTFDCSGNLFCVSGIKKNNDKMGLYRFNGTEFSEAYTAEKVTSIKETDRRDVYLVVKDTVNHEKEGEYGGGTNDFTLSLWNDTTKKSEDVGLVSRSSVGLVTFSSAEATTIYYPDQQKTVATQHAVSLLGIASNITRQVDDQKEVAEVISYGKNSALVRNTDGTYGLIRKEQSALTDTVPNTEEYIVGCRVNNDIFAVKNTDNTSEYLTYIHTTGDEATGAPATNPALDQFTACLAKKPGILSSVSFQFVIMTEGATARDPETGLPQ